MAVVAGTIVAMVLVVLIETFARRRPTTTATAVDADGPAGTSVPERETAGATA